MDGEKTAVHDNVHSQRNELLQKFLNHIFCLRAYKTDIDEFILNLINGLYNHNNGLIGVRNAFEFDVYHISGKKETRCQIKN